MTEPRPDDARWLNAAVRFARPLLGTTGGHPAVAALVVDENEGRVFARTIGGPGGTPSAAISAIADAGMNAGGRTLFTTLEPSSEDAQMIVAAGLGRVVIGVRAPGGEKGRGVAALLEQQGLDTVVADHPASAELHEAYVHRTRKGRPLTTLRLAISADGMIARKDGAPLELMSETSRDFIGLQRALSDAVLVGARTAELDDPPLTPGLKGLGDRAYARIVLVGRKVPPTGLQLLAPGHPVWVLCERGKDFGLPPPVEFITVEGKNGRPDLKKAMALLGQRGVSSLLVEGGARLTEAMLAAELADRLLLIETPAEVGRAGLPATPLGGIHGRLRAAGFVETGTRELGPDRLLTYDRQF